MPDTAPKKRFALPREIRLILSFGSLIFVLAYLVLPLSGPARHSLPLLTSVNPLLVIIGVALEVSAILAYVELTRTVMHPYAPSRLNTLRVNMAALAISHVVPGGTVPAGAFSFRIFNELCVPKETNAFGLAAQGAGSAVVLNIIFWIALVISIPLNGFSPAYGFAALIGVFLLMAFFGTILLITRGQRHADAWLRAIARHVPSLNPDAITALLTKVADRITLLIANRRKLWWAFTWATLNWLLDATCLWVFLWSFGVVVSPIDLLVAYGLANVLAAIPLTPAGLGVVEGVLITSLVGFGVPHSQAILAVLAYRLVNFWIPIPLGGVAYASWQWRRPADIRPAKASGSDPL